MKKIVILFIVISLVSCKKDTNTKDNGLYRIYGKVLNIQPSSSEIPITLSNEQNNYITYITKSGEYEFQNIKAGEYKLNVSQNVSEGSIEKTLKVSISESDEMLNIPLPNPVQIFCTAHPSRSITLNWTKSLDPGYREYKIYKGYNTGLDETTGTLLHVATNASDTVYAINGVEPNSDHYYRVFVMDELGKIAGSNVLHVKTDSDPVIYTLELETNFAGIGGLGTISGVTYDGNYIWLAYRLSIGGFYDNDKVTLAKYDCKNYSLIDSLSFNDRYEPLGGLTSDGQNLWLQYSTTGTDNNLICKIDPITKKKTNMYATDYGIWGLCYYKNELYCNYYYCKIDKINPNTGGVISTHNISSSDLGGNSYGIAVRDNEIWITGRLGPVDKSINIFNSDFSLKGYVKNPMDYSQICFLDDRLIIANESRVFIYNIK